MDGWSADGCLGAAVTWLPSDRCWSRQETLATAVPPFCPPRCVVSARAASSSDARTTACWRRRHRSALSAGLV